MVSNLLIGLCGSGFKINLVNYCFGKYLCEFFLRISKDKGRGGVEFK